MSQFYKNENEFKGKYSKGVLNTLYLAYKPYIFRIIFFLVLGLIGRFLLLANTNIVGFWVDSFCKVGTGVTCRQLPSFFANFGNDQFLHVLMALSTSGLILTLIFRVAFSRISAQAISQIYDETTWRTSRLPIEFFDRTPAGRVITRFSSDYGNVFRLFGGPLAEFVACIFDLISLIILMMIASPYYIPLLIAVGILNYFTFKANQKHLRQARRDLSLSRSPSITHFAETAQGSNAIRAFLKENTFTKRFLKLDGDYQAQKLKTIKKVLFFSFQMNSITALLLLLTGIFSYYMSQYGLVSTGSIGVAFSFVILSGNTVQTFFEWLAQLEEAMVGVERLDHYLRMTTEDGAKLPASCTFNTDQEQYTLSEEKSVEAQVIQPNLVNAEIKFEDVFLKYDENLPFILKNINFTIKAGEKVGIVGRTGSGKSSLIQTLFYLYPATSGQVTIAGMRPQTKDFSVVDINIYRSLISYIPQDPSILSGTLRENLDILGKKSSDELFSVLNKVSLSQFASEKGLNYKIEEKGKNLSSGEKQLICLARCLLKKSPVIVMDEATSSIDPQTESILSKATDTFFKDQTQIIIAHRLSTLNNCDRILWLQNGEIINFDKPQTVLKDFMMTNLTI